jgi:hypothetical protein
MSSNERRESVIDPPDRGPPSCRTKHVPRVERRSRSRRIATTTRRTGLDPASFRPLDGIMTHLNRRRKAPEMCLPYLTPRSRRSSIQKSTNRRYFLSRFLSPARLAEHRWPFIPTHGRWTRSRRQLTIACALRCDRPTHPPARKKNEKNGGQRKTGDTEKNGGQGRKTGESGKEVRSPPPPPLRTVHVPFSAYGSSLHERPSRDAAHPVSPSSCRGSADGSGHVTTPSCHTSRHLLDCARPDGGCARAVPPPEEAARTSRIDPLVPPRDIRSGLDPPRYASASRPTAPPGRVPTPDRRGWLHSESSASPRSQHSHIDDFVSHQNKY